MREENSLIDVVFILNRYFQRTMSLPCLTDSEEEFDDEEGNNMIGISKIKAKQLYEEAGTLMHEDEHPITFSKYTHLLR